MRRRAVQLGVVTALLIGTPVGASENQAYEFAMCGALESYLADFMDRGTHRDTVQRASAFFMSLAGKARGTPYTMAELLKLKENLATAVAKTGFEESKPKIRAKTETCADLARANGFQE